MYYIAYGSNLNMWQMSYRCPDAKPVGKSVMKGWRLVFNGVATIVPDDEYDTPVGIWQISERDEKALDRYEGYPYLYRKEYQTLVIKDKDGNERCEDALVYVMNEGRKMPFPPSESYYETIEEGYRNFKMDSSALKDALNESFIYLSYPNDFDE